MVEGKWISGPSVERKADALPRLREKIAQLSSTNSTVNGLVAELLDRREETGEWRASTVYVRRALAETVYKHPFGEKKAETVTQREFEEFYKSLKGSAHHRKNIAALVAKALRLIGKELKVSISTDLVSAKTRVLTPEEQKRFVKELTEEDRVPILMMLRMGLRRGEALGVMHEDREEDGIVIRRSVSFRKNGFFISKPKTRASESWVPIPDELKGDIGGGEGFVTCDPKYPDLPRRPTWLRDRVIKAAERAGIGKVNPHDLRHTAAMNFLEAGVDVVTAAEILRHDPIMLSKVYAKSRRDLKRGAMEKLGGLVDVQSEKPATSNKNLPN